MDTMLVLTGNGVSALNDLPEKFKPTYVVSNLKEGSELLCL
jgi:ribonucleotide monophosphatase NagD (HAD superfamily)